MRIDVVMLISGLDEETLGLRRDLLRLYAFPWTEVQLVPTRNAPLSVYSHAEMELAAPGILERVTLSKREGADAVVIWGGHYPSVITSRDLVGIPVVGPGMASMYIASALAKGFSLLVQLPEVVGVAKRQVRDLGLEDRCVGIYSIGILVLELRKPESFERVRDLAVDSIEEREADVVCFGCMALNDHAPRLSEALAESHLGAIVIYPGKAVIRFAELLGGIGPSHSNRSYPYPTKGVKFSP